jgi:hypothetical protein
MNLVRRSWLVVLMTLFVGTGTGVAQSRIQLAQGQRPIQDKVSFVVDIRREKNENPRYAEAPEDLQIFTRFNGPPASGRVYVDGKAIGRFDESRSFNSNPIDVTYGRHTITLTVTSPTSIYDFYVTIRGGVAHEILDEQEPAVALAPDLSKRVADLERKVTALEAELTAIKKKRNH